MKNLNKPGLFNVCISVFLLFSFIGITISSQPPAPTTTTAIPKTTSSTTTTTQPFETPLPPPTDVLQCLPETTGVPSGNEFKIFKTEV
jgi:hypothetical protein